MARHSAPNEPETMDYFEKRAFQMDEAQKRRLIVDPPADDDFLRHMAELKESDLIEKFRTISATYQRQTTS